MKIIIAATDFSPAATHAVYYAADMAKAIGAELMLVNIYNIPVNYSDGVVVMPVDELRTGSENGLEKLKAEIEQKYTGELQVSCISRMGNITEELQDITRSKQPFAVVIGTRGKTNFEKTVFGSSALSIIRHLECPVICIPPGVKYEKRIRKVAFACDFRDVALTVPAETILMFINPFRPQLHILNIDYKEKNFRAGTPEDSFTLHQLFYDYNPVYHYIEHKDTGEGIIQFVTGHNIDMLITIPKRHNLLEKLFKKSTTHNLVKEMNIPLVCIHG